ncbi:hypothetical protein [Bradyrhizobium sp. RT4b]|uniref:hypothetical protein n=1 Tax=unclassified Bradyrhizobium TaxID=2631580 RepID=UPI003391EC50
MTGGLAGMLGWGAVGGALPTISKIAGTYGADFAAPPPQWDGVLIAIALYAVIGAVVARAMDNRDMKQALFAGIAAPAIVASILAGVTDSKRINPPSTQSPSTTPIPAPTKSGLLISSAFAQAAPAPAGPDFRPFVIEAAVDGEIPVRGELKVQAIVPSGSPKDIGVMPIQGAFYRAVLNVPKQATALRFVSRPGDVTYEVPLSGQDRIFLKILPRPTTNRDLLWALGGQRLFEIGGISKQQ